MRTAVAVCCGVLCSISSARADPPKTGNDYVADWASMLGNGWMPAGTTATRLGFTDGGLVLDKVGEGVQGGGGYITQPAHAVIAWASDKKVAWVATDILQFGNCCCGPCDLKHPVGTEHATWVAVLGADWHMTAFSVTSTASDAVQAKAFKAGKLPDALPRKIDAGAEDAAKLFEATIADPKALAGTVSDRKDVVLYGSDLAERYTGGATVAAQLVKWNLKLVVRDGVQAGVAGASVAWVAANVDATSLKKPKDPAMPYRLFAVYERSAAGWKLVSASFSVALP